MSSSSDSISSSKGWNDIATPSTPAVQDDPDGSIVADLQRLGELEDGAIGTVDSGRLLESRLASAGVEVSLDSYPGGHTTLDKVQDLIAYLQAAVND